MFYCKKNNLREIENQCVVFRKGSKVRYGFTFQPTQISLTNKQINTKVTFLVTSIQQYYHDDDFFCSWRTVGMEKIILFETMPLSKSTY